MCVRPIRSPAPDMHGPTIRATGGAGAIRPTAGIAAGAKAGRAARIAEETGDSGLLPNSCAILPARRFRLSENRNTLSRGKNGVWRGARGLASRTALRSVPFISDTLIGDTE